MEIEQLIEFLKDTPNDPFLHYAIAQEHNKAGNKELALEKYKELVDKFHELAEPRVGLQIAQTLSGGVLGGQGLSVRDLAKLWSKMSYWAFQSLKYPQYIIR